MQRPFGIGESSLNRVSFVGGEIRGKLRPDKPHPATRRIAEVAELADALDSKSSVLNGRVGSSPTFGTYAPTGCGE